MLERYYDEKAKAFNDLRMRQLTIDEFVTNFVNLQRYLPYIKNEKAKVYRFISCLPQSYKDKIEFDMPKTVDEGIKKVRLYYLQFKQRSKMRKNWQHKKRENMEQ